MTILLALLGAVLGGGIGAVIGFFAVIVIGIVTGADGQQGALAMGAAMVGGPICLVLGAILGCILVLRLRRGRTPQTPEQAHRTALIVFGVVAAVLFTLWRVFFYIPPPPMARAPVPVMTLEVRMPLDMAGGGELENPSSAILTYGGDNLTPYGAVAQRIEGDHLIITAQHRMVYRFEGREMRAYLGPEQVIVADLGLPAEPDATDGYTDWRPVDALRPYYYGPDQPGAEAFSYRFKIDR